ncbi:hypothetical protein LOTGIDRAFT_115714 [Lottia gigantea]|uniref:Hemoglobinase n=1 Tax=Lottia gigantea TaxID=225164 RepID=V3ZY68_LOTGI|nr:hypothetical protein LOTGIDRAFT_115714 [Lottia gigantea]ESO96473.1 hypothetical protein LOTGIDRAFT_115714 [Lottia gigantea]
MAPTILISLALAVSCCVLIQADFVDFFEQKPNEDGKHWALLVAGSSGYYNYRHQADVCHAYQIMKKHGIPDERIVVMMVDDIAHNIENPDKGSIINQPNGPNVYPGVPKDYTHEKVNPKMFLEVLQGNVEAVKSMNGSGKVINSGPNDHVFVNFVDHGAPGILGFPREFLHATQLSPVVKKMAKDNKFAKLVFYVEACESGSIFAGDLLPDNINVFATTAANAHESSYACYFDNHLKTYLGDVYSVMWMQDSDKVNLNTETLSKQFDITKKETNTSHVMEFGDLKIGQLTVGEFQGKSMAVAVDNSQVPNPNLDAVKSEDVKLSILEQRLLRAQSEEEKEAIENELEIVVAVKNTISTFKNIIATAVNHQLYHTQMMFTLKRPLTQHTCYKTVVEHLKTVCPGMNLPQNDFAMRHFYTLVNLCEEQVVTDVIVDAMEKVAMETKFCSV